MEKRLAPYFAKMKIRFLIQLRKFGIKKLSNVLVKDLFLRKFQQNVWQVLDEQMWLKIMSGQNVVIQDWLKISNVNKTISKFHIKTFLIQVFQLLLTEGVFEKYSLSPFQATVTCRGQLCHVTCINGSDPELLWPDGTVTQRSVVKCQRGEIWKPNVGNLICS